jgi:G3E family GTPase
MSVINIDAALIRNEVQLNRGQEKLVEMSNGCICCTLREDLLVEVRKLAAEGRFDHLLIESTGIGDPMPVAATFDFTDEQGHSMSDLARIDTMVTVVDAFNLLADYASTDLLEQRGQSAGDGDTRTLAALLAEQIEFADVVVVNKIDKVDATRRDEVAAVVKALNPVAEIVFADHGRVPLDRILGTGLFDMERASRMPGWVRELEGRHVPETEAYGIESFVLRSHEPLHPWRFSSFMELPFTGLLRAKGYVWLATRPDWVVNYSRAGNTATHEPIGRWWAAAPKHDWPAPGTDERRSIDARWLEPYGDRLNEVVFIGRRMDRAAIEQAWRSMHLNHTEARKGPPGGRGYAGWTDLPDPFPQWQRTEVAA